jgi:hypothetical protein
MVDRSQIISILIFAPRSSFPCPACVDRSEVAELEALVDDEQYESEGGHINDRSSK